MSKDNKKKSEKAIDAIKRNSYIKLKYNLDQVFQEIHKISKKKKS